MNDIFTNTETHAHGDIHCSGTGAVSVLKSLSSSMATDTVKAGWAAVSTQSKAWD